MKRLLFIFATILFFNPLETFASNQQEMLQCLDVIKNTFEVKYAPAEWKKEYIDWSLDEQYSLAKDRITKDEAPSTKDFQRIMRDFLASTQDHHVNIHFFSRESASLPITLQEARGRYFVTWCNPEVTDVEIGDEILTFNAKPVSKAVEEVKNQEIGSSDSATDHALATYYLTERKGSLGHQIPKGSAIITVKDKSSGEITQHELLWDYKPEKILRSPSLAHGPLDSIKKEFPYFFHNMSTPLFEHFTSDEINDKNSPKKPLPIGERNSELPPLGQPIHESPDNFPFQCYVYETPEGNRIGFIRVQSYMEPIGQLEQVIAWMDLHTEALVIDQQNNPGGAGLCLFGLTSMLTETPIILPTERKTLTQQDADYAVSFLEFFEESESSEDDEESAPSLFEQITGFQFTDEVMHSFANYQQSILDQWNSGNDMTEPNPLLGFGIIAPHTRAHYSKPIIILVNALDFSCGDIFPAIMQDNGRAVILGTKTAGAGGAVEVTSLPNRLGIKCYSYTASIIDRLNQQPIENLGITPDIIYEVTPEDVQNGYQNYIELINRTVSELLQQ